MSDSALLDALFLMTGCLCLMIGFIRGVHREVFVTAAVLAGGSLAIFWAESWGQRIADWSGVRPGVCEFAVAIALLSGAIVVLGYGGAAAARAERGERWSRLAGALLAGVNGALVSAFLLRDIQRFLADDATERSIQDSYVARFLRDDLGWMLISAAVAMTLFIALALLISGERSTVLSPTRPAGLRSWHNEERVYRGRHRRLGWGRDDGKVEPSARGYDAQTGRYAADAPRLMDSMPIAPVDSAFWSLDRARGAVAGGPEWAYVGAQPMEPMPVKTVGPDPIRCVSCDERMRSDDAFCSKCGRENA